LLIKLSKYKGICFRGVRKRVEGKLIG